MFVWRRKRRHSVVMKIAIKSAYARVYVKFCRFFGPAYLTGCELYEINSCPNPNMGIFGKILNFETLGHNFFVDFQVFIY